MAVVHVVHDKYMYSRLHGCTRTTVMPINGPPYIHVHWLAGYKWLASVVGLVASYEHLDDQ